MVRRPRRFRYAALAALLVSGAAWAQRLPKPGFNLFSKQQDIQLGKEAAAEIEKTVELVRDREISAYIEALGQRLVRAPEADDYPYTFKVVRDDTINAFALPGGPTYVHTGLLLAVENEAQLAGVLAHEIAHVALRHGTSQASKANFIQLAALLASEVVGQGSLTAQLARIGIGFGANSVFLKFSRSAERDADVLGAYIMARAGYDPLELARFFEKLEAETGRRSAVEQFFSSHPNPGNRRERIQQELPYLPRTSYRQDLTGQLQRIQARVREIAPPKAKTAPGLQSEQRSTTGSGLSHPSETAHSPTGERSGWRTYQGRAFHLQYPDDWHLAESPDRSFVTIAPENGYVRLATGETAISVGVVVGITPTEVSATDLDAQTRRFIGRLQQANPSLRPSGRPPRRVQLWGREALVTVLESASPLPGQRETDLLVTASHPAGLVYLLCAAPQREYPNYQPTFESILQSIVLP